MPEPGHALRMKKTLLNVFSAVALSTLVACGGATAVGVYELDKAAFAESILAGMSAEAKADPKATEMVKSRADGMNISFELKEDGSSHLSSKITMMGEEPQESSATGTWKLDGDKLTMNTKDAAGKEETRTAVLKDGAFSVEDGFSTKQDNGQKRKMTFRLKK